MGLHRPGQARLEADLLIKKTRRNLKVKRVTAADVVSEFRGISPIVLQQVRSLLSGQPQPQPRQSPEQNDNAFPNLLQRFCRHVRSCVAGNNLPIIDDVPHSPSKVSELLLFRLLEDFVIREQGEQGEIHMGPPTLAFPGHYVLRSRNQQSFDLFRKSRAVTDFDAIVTETVPATEKSPLLRTMHCFDITLSKAVNSNKRKSDKRFEEFRSRLSGASEPVDAQKIHVLLGKDFSDRLRRPPAIWTITLDIRQALDDLLQRRNL